MTLQRFWNKVLFTIDCWLWLASKDKDGYGIFKFQHKVIRAYQYSYELYKGKIPSNLEIDHICENRACVNPNHLQAITHQENVKNGSHHNINKTHCPKGHKYTLKNTYYLPQRPNRKCRICHKIESYNYRKSKKIVQNGTNIKI